MNLNENINSIRKLMGLSEQRITLPDVSKNKPMRSDYLGTGGQFEKNQYGGVKIDQYNKMLQTLNGQTIKRVRLIFPQDISERVLLWFAKVLGVITGIYDSLQSAIEFVNTLAEKKVKVDEFVIGSHGQYGFLLLTEKNDQPFYDNDFLTSFKPIIHSNTKVFFTACHGAEFLDMLKTASEKLGVGVYGAAGIYYPVINVSDNGFYYCKPDSFKVPTKQKLNPYKIEDYIIEVRLLDLTRPEMSVNKNENFKITILEGVFDKNIPEPIFGQTRMGDINKMISVIGRDYYHRYNLEIEWWYYMWRYITVDGLLPGEDHNNNRWNRKAKEVGDPRLTKYLIQMFKSNQIVVEMTYNGKFTNIRSLPDVLLPEIKVSNEFLLENNLCQKVENIPINWIQKAIQ